MQFRGDEELGLFWRESFSDDTLIQGDVRLVCEESFPFTLLCLNFEQSRLRTYARDALHFALLAEYRDHTFWDFLLNDTFNMQDLFGIDQADLVMMVILILEWLNHRGIYLPRTCYDPSVARSKIACEEVKVSKATERFLRFVDFVPFDFALSALLSLPVEDDINKVVQP